MFDVFSFPHDFFLGKCLKKIKIKRSKPSALMNNGGRTRNIKWQPPGFINFQENDEGGEWKKKKKNNITQSKGSVSSCIIFI
jgi:hypothetical protein